MCDLREVLPGENDTHIYFEKLHGCKWQLTWISGQISILGQTADDNRMDLSMYAYV